VPKMGESALSKSLRGSICPSVPEKAEKLLSRSSRMVVNANVGRKKDPKVIDSFNKVISFYFNLNMTGSNLKSFENSPKTY
jgi:hypothetical protein